MKYTLSVLVENQPGVLSKVVSLFARRGYNIDSLAVGTTEDPTMSRMTIVGQGDDHILEQVEKQLNKLVEVIKAAIPASARRAGGHPAKRTFQALRIEVNSELDVLRRGLDAAIRWLNPKGRIAVISYHSLEDRIVKSRFRLNENPCICPHDFPVCVCGRKSKGKVVSRKPILPSEEELEENSRSKSAKLRVFERGQS